jgi:pimeloyl-ACP methyl ester carboxylesterase
MDILLVSGFMLDADLWSGIRADLARLGRVIDADTTQDSSIDTMADRAIASMPGPTIVIGFSMGGYVARAIAYRVPHLVRGLALIATSSRPHGGAQLKPDMMFKHLGRAAIARSLHPDNRTDELMIRVQRMSERLGADVFRRQSGMVRQDDTNQLERISCPTLVVAAAQDELRSVAESQILHDRIKSSTMTIIEPSGHLIPMEQPHQLLAALKTLVERTNTTA